MCIMIAVEGSHGLLVRSVGIVLEQSLTFQHVLQKKLRVDQFEYRRRPVVPIPQAICVAGMDLLELCALWWETNPDEAANHRRSTMRVTLTLSCWHGPAPFLRDQLRFSTMLSAHSRRIAC